jgi:hypothetical protein
MGVVPKAKAAARKAPARKATGKTASAAKAKPYRGLRKRQGDPGAHLIESDSK